MLDRRLATWLWNHVQKLVVLAVDGRKLSSSARLGNQLQLWQRMGIGSRWTGTVIGMHIYARVAHALHSDGSHPPWVKCVLLSGCFYWWLFLSSALARLAWLLVLVIKAMSLWKFIPNANMVCEPGINRATPGKRLHFKWTKIGHCEAALGWIHGIYFFFLQFVWILLWKESFQASHFFPHVA